MTIESLGRKNGPKPGEHGVAGPRHSRRPQPETRAVPTARPKPAPPRPGPGSVPGTASGTGSGSGSGSGSSSGAGSALTAGSASASASAPTPTPRPPSAPGFSDEARREATRGQAGPVNGPKNAETDTGRERRQGPGTAGGQTTQPGHNAPAGPQGPMQRRSRSDGKAEGQSRGNDRSLYDGGSPSANRLGPMKAMRARDVSRPRD